MSLFEIKRFGYDITDVKDFLIDRPNGSGDYLFLQFKSPVRIRLDHSVVTTKPGACIVYSPDCPQWFHSPDEEMRTNWFHFSDRSLQVLPMLEALNLPLNKLFYPSSLAYLDPLFQAVRNELVIDDDYGKELISGLIVQFLAKLARSALQKPRTRLSVYKQAALETLKTIRMAVQSKPEYNWRIAEMAAMAKLSEPRFTVLYREFFKVSPKQDLIQIRLEKAKYLLMNNAVTVQEVANMTGYESVYHFIRQFKKVVGCSPGKYYSDLFSGKHNEKDQFFN